MKYLLFAFLLIFLTNCGVSDSSNNENLVAFHAYNDLGRQIYTVNFDDPKNSLKQLTNNDHQNVFPLFKDDKKFLIYGDMDLEAFNNYAHWIFDINNGTTKLIEVVDFDYPVLHGRMKILHPSENAIYVGIVPGPWAAYDIFEYTFSTKKMRAVTYDIQKITWPVGFFNIDTLIAVTGDSLENMGLYKMDLDGNRFDMLTNPHLDRLLIDSIIQYGPVRFYYSTELEMFLLAMIKEDSRGYRIAATSLDGSYYEEFTSGEFIDDYPVFGPNNDYIIFSRAPIDDHSGHGMQLMYIDLSDGSEHVLVDESMFPNLYGFTSPSF